MKQKLISELFGGKSASSSSTSQKVQQPKNPEEKHRSQQTAERSSSSSSSTTTRSDRNKKPEKRSSSSSNYSIDSVTTGSSSNSSSGGGKSHSTTKDKTGSMSSKDNTPEKHKSASKVPADSTHINKQEMGDLIVKYLMPFYKNKKIETKEEFKSLARDMSHKAAKHKMKSKAPFILNLFQFKQNCF